MENELERAVVNALLAGKKDEKISLSPNKIDFCLNRTL